MKRLGILVLLVTACALPLQAANARVLEGSAEAADLSRVSVEVGVGDVEIVPSSDERIHYEVTLRPRRGGIFSSMKRAERDVREAELEADAVGSELSLRIDSRSEDRRFEEDWKIAMPPRLALELDLGVGDVEISNIQGGIEIDAGVGDIVIENPASSITVEAGVGDVVITGSAEHYGHVECTAGVGDTDIRVRGQNAAGDGFVGHSSSWNGDGPHEIQVELGVGDANVKLD